MDIGVLSDVVLVFSIIGDRAEKMECSNYGLNICLITVICLNIRNSESKSGTIIILREANPWIGNISRMNNVFYRLMKIKFW